MGKKILLLSMPNYVVGFDRAGRFPNLALSSIAGNIDEDLIEKIAIADLVTVRTDIRKYITRLLKQFNPDIVGLTAMSFQYQTAVEIAKIIKSIKKKIITVFGGYHVTLAYELISKSNDINYIDFLIRGEGEVAFNKLVKAIIDRESKFSEIENLSYKKEGSFVHNPRSKNLDLNQIKLPKRNIRLTHKYYTFGKKADVIETSRGCTMSCNFCCMPFMYGRTFRKYSMERIIQDIKNAVENGAEALFITDDNAFLNTKHMHNVCDDIIKTGLNNIDYFIQASVHGIASDENLVKKMAKAGFKFVFLGIENVNSEDLDFLSKDKKTLIESEHAIKLLQDNGIIASGGFIVGLPEDSEKAIWNNFHFARKMKLDAPFFFVLTPHYKTGVRNNFIEQNLVTNLYDFCFYDGLQVNVRTKSLSPEDLSYILWKMNGKYGDLEYLKFNKIKKVYPFFFWKWVLKTIPRIIWNRIRKISLHNYEYINYKASRKRLIKRLKNWLLDREETILLRLNELKLL
ncbi:MAG: B12-binding domain-containing radical SAM protein [Candidatus Cloacimonetes bacterium]|nr:B12-binding domain-containing radical SAM protein [Candidatus Cloacimonadota bacterium]